MARKTAEAAAGAATPGALAQTRSKAPLGRKPKSLREEQQLSTRRKLIEATFQSFSDKGFEAVTIADIVKAAGTSRATFYLHFASKSEALSASWAELEQRHMITQWRKLDALAPWTDDAVYAWVTEMVGLWEGTQNFAIASNQAVSTDTEMSRKWFAGICGYLSHVPQVLRRLGRNSAHPDHRFIMMCTQMDRSAFMYLTDNFPGSREEFIATLAEFWRNALVDVPGAAAEGTPPA